MAMALVSLVPPDTHHSPRSSLRSTCREHILLQTKYHILIRYRDGAVKDTYKYLGDLDLALFPALREIQVYSCKWPTTE